MSELAYNEFGDGPPLVILHGLFGSARNWDGIAKRLADRHRVFAVDLPNHGASPWRPRMDYPGLADEVRAFIDARGLDRPAFFKQAKFTEHPHPFRGGPTDPRLFRCETRVSLFKH